MSYGMGAYTDPWTKAAVARYARTRRGISGLGALRHLGDEVAPADTNLPAPVTPEASLPMLLGWGAAVLIAGGIFWAVARKGGGLSANRRRRSSRRPRKNRLTASQRAKLPRSVFVFPKERAWPLDTARRARAAISYLYMGRVRSASDFNKIRNAIRRHWPEVWAQYGHGLTWEKSKRAKSRRATTKARHRKLKVAANRRRRHRG